MTEATIFRIESRYPDILTAESEVKGLHYLYEAGLDRVAIAPSGGVLAYVSQEPVLRLSERGTDGQGSFSSASQMWPTPTAGQCGMTARTSNRPIEKSTKLGTQVYVRSGLAPMVATPLARDYRTGQRKRFGNPLRSKNLNDQIGGQLNPMWVEWLMGFPIGWTDLSASETP